MCVAKNRPIISFLSPVEGRHVRCHMRNHEVSLDMPSLRDSRMTQQRASFSTHMPFLQNFQGTFRSTEYVFSTFLANINMDSCEGRNPC